MAHDQLWALLQRDLADGAPFFGLHAQPVHAGIQLNAKRARGQRFHMAGHLFDGIEQRDQAKVANDIRIARHMPRIDKDARAFANGFA